ncbi:UDP-glucose 4-epimerase [Hyalella azteca]|uniref:UDP-glucose 4-epimerase n=1 Tax=Hyalella azteca TaxID=294128 RepID=A0A8B7NNJ7_HYAAZ|nr:UDP-glucose 4-epimerase [Hyalella azteca]
MEGQCSTVLVTGGAGYAGSHTVLVLLQWGYQVVVVDNCTNCAAPTAPDALPPSLLQVKDICQKAPVFYQAALDDGPALLSIFKKHKIDAVIHFAALKAVGESVQKPLMYYHNNLLATISLLEAMEAAGVRRLVFSSSATVYGIPQYLPIDEDHPVGQSITNPYGHTKHMCEQILRDIVQSNNDWKVILLRYFNPVGAHESGKMGEDPIGVPNNLMPFIAQVAVGRREKLSIFGNDFDTDDGTGVRDYIHVMDLAEGHVSTLRRLLSDDFRGCRAYNLGTGVGVSVMQMLQAFQKSCGRSLPYEVVARRAGDCARMLASCTRARTELGWTATRTLQDMCDDTWRWQSSHPNGYATS